ncbi:hypothetical protein HAX54_007588 [Datura stramonium]|uniref:Uncharacterized protein n=1 Tax=Datura stramonium TaxID=4076 RepID=A0ABS8RVJ8_DATST|nr:hypothetical protein [Datura stramonium]
MTPTTNTEGEPGTQDKSTQYEQLDTFRMPDEQDTTTDLSHLGTTEEPESTTTQNFQTKERGSSGETEQRGIKLDDQVIIIRNKA